MRIPIPQLPMQTVFRVLLLVSLTACSATDDPALKVEDADIPAADTVPAIRPAEPIGKSPAATSASDRAIVEGTRPTVLAAADAAAGRYEVDELRAAREPLDREAYTRFDSNPVHLAAEDPVSTFSVDVDTASYSNVRRWLNQGTLPRRDAVRVEELINYFAYDYPAPEGDVPFSVFTEVGPSPWHEARRLLHIGIRGKRPDELPPANLVFLIDVSGSMQSPDKLALLKTAIKLLTAQLDRDDRIAIAVYAGAAGTVLDPTPGSERAKIEAAIDALEAGGSTNGGAGIRLAYSMARQAFVDGGINRVILATDGDFNVGTTDQRALKNLVETERASGIALTVLGFGTGNYNDALMQELAQAGNGNAAYIDTLGEARKVLVDELAATLEIIASDVKIQVEFNPAVVAEYRLIGFETRHLEREDFNNDAVDAGDIGAGHTMTALYEIALVNGGGTLVDPLRYAAPESKPRSGHSGEIAHVKLRYKTPGSQASRLIARSVDRGAVQDDLDATSENYRFSAAVAGFGQLLRGAEYTGGFGFDDAAELAAGARGRDVFGYRGEFLGLVRTAAALTPRSRDSAELAEAQ